MRDLSSLFAGQTAVFVLALAGVLPAAQAQEKVTYNDQLLPLIEQHCANCHNPDKKKGDLVLTSYNALLKGGGSGVVAVSGNVDGSKLWKCITHAEEPTMPPNKPKLGDKDLDIFRKWIAGGLLESSGSKAVTAAKPSVDLTLKVSNIGKPDGPPPMPGELPLEPVVHTKRSGAVSALAASPWAPLVAIAGQKQILLYNTTNLDLLGILPFIEGQPWDLKFSRSGKLLLAAGGHGAKSGRVVLWNIENGERVTTLGEEYDSVLAADISPDQSRVALGGPSRLVKIHSTKTGEVEHKMKKHTDWVTAVAFSPNGEWLATGDRNGGVVIWDADNGQELFTTLGHKSAVTALSWRDDSRLVASSSEDGSVKLWESSEGKQAKTWTPHANGAMAVAYSHDGKFVTCGRDGAVTTWSADGNKLKGFDFTGDIALRCTFSHDGSRVIAVDFTGHAAIWSAADGKKLGELDVNPPLLAEQIVLAQKRVEELGASATQPPAGPSVEEQAATKLQEELGKAREAVAKAQKVFDAKAAEVARLKGLSTQANPPADIDQKLIAARAAREQARTATNTAALTLEAKLKESGGAQTKAVAPARAIDPAQELAAAKARLARLTRAQAQGGVFRAKESVAVKKRELDSFKASLAGKQDDIKQLTKSLETAKDTAAKTKLKADLKAATADVKTLEGNLKKCSAELTAEQAKADKAVADFERMQAASAGSGTRAKL
jgi:WD40 repeat protein